MEGLRHSYEMKFDGDFSIPERAAAPHRRLWLRVWWRAVCDYVLYKSRANTKQRKLADDAAGWLFEKSCYGECPPSCMDSRMSFEAFCAEFGIPIADVRRWILALDAGEINRIGRNLP